MTKRIRPNVAALSAYVPGEQPADPATVKLNTNENPYPPAPGVARVLQACATDLLRLYPDPACRALREAIARVHEVPVERVFCGNGSDEILALCIRAFVPDNGAVGYYEPSYSLYPVLASIADVRQTPLPLADDFSCPPMPADYDASLFFWTNPNAPTGLRCPEEALRAFAERTNGVLVVDEAYVDFADGDAMALAKSHDRVLVTRTLSKSYALAGIRLGYAVGPEPLIEALFKIKDAYNVNRLTQELGRAAVEDQAYMRLNADRIKATRNRIATELTQRGFAVWPSQTNFLWVKPNQCSARDMFERLRARNVLVRYFPSPRTKAHLRITVGTDEQMNQLLAALDA